MKKQTKLVETKVAETVYTTRTIPKTYYISDDDGQVFHTEQACEDYELFFDLINFKQLIPQKIIIRQYFMQLADIELHPLNDTLYFCKNKEEIFRVGRFLLTKLGYNTSKHESVLFSLGNEKFVKGWFFFSIRDGCDCRDELEYTNITQIVADYIELNEEYNLTTDPTGGNDDK